MRIETWVYFHHENIMLCQSAPWRTQVKITLRAALTGLFLVCTFSAGAAEVNNEVFLFNDVLNPKTISKPDCERKQHAVWVEAEWQDRGMFGRQAKQTARGCVRYFPSSNAKGANTALLFLHGDVYSNEDINLHRKIYEKVASYKDQIVQAERMSMEIGLPVIRVGRPGAYGSTGMSHVSERRMPVEAYLVNSALYAIKARYGYMRIQLVGQSGGGGLVGAILTLGRTDLDCAVVGSGAVSIKTHARLQDTKEARKGLDQTGQSLSDVYDPIDHIDGVQYDSSRRVFVLGDPRDHKVGFNSQKEFHQKLIAKGIPATLLTADAKDSKHHELSLQSLRVAGWCKAGYNDTEIQARLNEGK